MVLLTARGELHVADKQSLGTEVAQTYCLDDGLVSLCQGAGPEAEEGCNS